MKNIKEMETYLFNIFSFLKNSSTISSNDLKKVIYIYCRTLDPFEKELSFKILNLINKDTFIKEDTDYKDFILTFANNLNNKTLGVI